MKSPIINIASIELIPMPTVMEPTGGAAERFDARMGFISTLIGEKQLGYNITAIPKGKRAFPFHNHQGNEEMFRIGDDAFPIKEGDIIICPAGDKETAHQIIKICSRFITGFTLPKSRKRGQNAWPKFC